jgi:hypothetical protein
VNSLEREADLHPLGRLFMRLHLRELLETRLRLTQSWKGRSDVLESDSTVRLRCTGSMVIAVDSGFSVRKTN